MTSSYATAKRLLGCNFLPSRNSLKADNTLPIPWSEASLEKYSESHILSFVPALSIREMAISSDLSHFFNQTELADEKFMKSPPIPGWHLIQKKPVFDSGNKWWLEQRLMLDKGETVPSAAVLTYSAIMYFLQTGLRLFENCFVRTTDVCRDGRRVSFYNFNQDGVHYDSWSEINYHHIKVAAEILSEI